MFKTTKMTLLTIALSIATNAMAVNNPNAKVLPQLDCLIEPSKVVDVGSQQVGVVQEILFKEGEVVEKGQVLVRLESSVEQAAVKLALQKTKMDHEISTRKDNLRYELRNLERMKSLYYKNSASFRELDQARNKVGLVKLELEQSIQTKKIAEIELKKAKEQLKRRTIRSPISGVVMERYISVGEMVRDKRIVKIAQINPLRVDVIVPSKLFPVVKQGMIGKVKSEMPGAKTKIAEVDIVDKVIDASSGTFDVRLTMPNDGNKLPGGVRCRVELLKKQRSFTANKSTSKRIVKSHEKSLAKQVQNTAINEIVGVFTNDFDLLAEVGELYEKERF